MTARHDVVFLRAVDATLLDNDRIELDLRQQLTRAFGAERQERYWVSFSGLRPCVDFFCKS
jgi:hypothetical protein